MAKIMRLLVILSAPLAITACDTGSVDNGGGTFTPGETGGDDDTDQPPDLVCAAEYSISGSFAAANAPGEDIGCDPAGTWTVTMTETSNDCVDAIALDAQYVYTVGGNATDGWTYTYNGTPEEDDPNSFLKHQASGSECSGSFLHYVENTNSLLNVRPVVIGATLEGTVFFERYSGPQQ